MHFKSLAGIPEALAIPGIARYIRTMPKTEMLKVASSAREEMADITHEVQKVVTSSEITDGICVLFTQHTTCGLTINENADPDVKSDMLGFLNRLIPQYEPNFKHFEHNSDSHIKTSLIGSSVTIPVADGKLALGRWQGIYLCEFDGPRKRKVLVKIL